MTQADSVHSTPPTNTPMTRVYKASLELDIIHQRAMARVAGEMLDQWHNQKTATQDLGVDAKEAIRLLKQWEDLVHFCVNHVSDMAMIWSETSQAEGNSTPVHTGGNQQRGNRE